MKNTFLILSLILFQVSLAQTINLKEGDIIFCESYTEGLSEAINKVTQHQETKNYSHMGILEKTDETWYVLHAGFNNGSEKLSLKSFILSQTDSLKKPRALQVYRLKDEFRYSIPQAIKQAKAMLGKPYNHSYILNDTSYYCSDFIYRSFNEAEIFELNPMTFKNPGTNVYHQSWVDYYNALNLPIPEGKLGCNPNGMAASEKLEYVGVLQPTLYVE